MSVLSKITKVGTPISALILFLIILKKYQKNKKVGRKRDTN